MSLSLFVALGLFNDDFRCSSYTPASHWITCKYRKGKDNERSDSDIN